MAKGLKGMIGKGNRSQEVIEAMKSYKCVYFGATGGVGALLARAIEKVRIIAYEDLGTEAIRQLVVKNFPVIVINDIYGNDLYKEGVKKYQKIGRL
jgi:fumarate hydratase subunit beta